MSAPSLLSAGAWRAFVVAAALAVIVPLAAAPAGLTVPAARAASDPAVAPTVVSLEVGITNSCGIFSDGTARCSGYNSSGQVGDGTTTWAYLAARVQGLEDVVSIGVGYQHACAVLGNGEAWCWGADDEGQLGDDATEAGSLVPVRVSGITDAVAISAYYFSTCALLADGTVTCWGKNDTGQLGTDPATTASSGVPIPVAGLSNVAAISAGGTHTCALLVGGGVRCWGANPYGQLGDGTVAASFEPVPVSGLADARSVSAGYDHTCALREGGAITCWGANYYVQLGNGYAAHQQCTGPMGTWDCSPTPVPVMDITDAVAVDSGGVFSCAVLADGTARCWGVNSGGRLGIGTDTGAEGYPVTPIGLDHAIAVSSGSDHTCAVRDDATAACWGTNNYGELLNGTGAWSSVPVPADFGIPTIAPDPASTDYPATLGWKVIFDRSVTGVTVDDFDMTGTTAPACQLRAPTGSGTTWVITADGCGDGQVVVRLKARSAEDAAGIQRPPFALAATPITLDTTTPWLSASPVTASPTASSTLAWSITTSEPVKAFTAADISFADATNTSTGCAVQSLVKDSLDETAWTLTVTGCSSGVARWRVGAGTFTDIAGNPGPEVAILADEILVDRTAPTVTTPAVTIRTGTTLTGSAIPVRVGWTGSDNAGGTGVAAYQLQRSLNGGAWTDVGTASLATAANVTISPSGTVRFRVRATDALGNAATKSSATVTPRLVQQTSSSVTYRGTWTTKSASTYSGGSLRYAKAKGASATLTFTGRAVALVTTNAALRGKVKVYVNGTYIETLDLRGDSATKVVAWRRSWSTSATRTIRLVVLGTAGRPRVDLDAFVVFR